MTNAKSKIINGGSGCSESKLSRFMHIKNGGASDLPPKKFLLCVNRPHHLYIINPGCFLARENS
jgi:hypothetical protein